MLASAFVAGALVSASPAFAEAVPVPGEPTVLINELSNGGSRSDSDAFVELRNWGDEAVDLTGWHVYRCNDLGLRVNVGRPESDLTGVVLQPGDIVTISRVGMPGALHVTEPYALEGFGLYLADPAARLIDAVGVYPNEPWMTHSECTVGRNLPNRLDFAADESWQRIAATGDVAADFIAAPATIDAPNATEALAREETSVVISEVASAGPEHADDDFVELVNGGTRAENIGGWELSRCTATGRSRTNTLEYTVPAGTVLAPGQRWVVAAAGFPGESDGALAHSLADPEFGVKLMSERGLLVDRLAVSSHGDSACQDGDAKLRAVLDAVSGESYQRTATGFVIARRTPGARNATVDTSLAAQPFSYPAAPGVAVSEIADDPTTEGMPGGTVRRNFVELGNYGAVAVDIGGWTVRRCEADGTRSRDLQFTVPSGTRLAPGEVYLAALAGTAAASGADVTYETGLNFLGSGVWLADANGTRVDSVGIYAANEMDGHNITPSPCTKGLALTTYLPDRLLEETFQRSRFTGVDAQDFLVAEATPGTIDSLRWVDPTARVVTVSTAALPTPGKAVGVAGVQPGLAATVLEAWAGVTDGGPLTARSGEAETALDAAAPAPVADDAYGWPYTRFVLDASALRPGSTVGWTGSTADNNELQFSVWTGAEWRLLDTGSTRLSGVLAEGDLRDGRVELLVQDGRRTTPTVTTERDGQLEDPAHYDFAVTHLTDTQYLSESYPEVYSQLVSWVADNADDRKIAFATHTGDMVQNWVDPDQNEVRARIEFERASAIQSILDDAGIANSVLPGNHDNKRGVTNDLFNEYFPPSRYEGTAWYGGSIAPGDNSANFSTFEHAGAKFLMLSLPFAYGEREIAWAEEVVTSHSDFNVIISTHEHVMPKTREVDALRAANARWTSRAQELYDRVIGPNRNVLIVLSGHFHGVGQIVTENAGGLEGHTVVELLADYQEFRTHTGERATGFFRMLQFDLDGSAIAVDTRSVRLAASYSNDYDYRQFLPDNGLATTPSNARPWRIVEAGLQGRYTEDDDEFTSFVEFQHPKLVATTGLLVAP